MTRARDLAAFVSNADGDIKFDTDTLFIDSSANRVGIGNTAPLRSLHVSGAGDTGLMLQTTNAVDDKEIWEIQAAADGSNHANLIMRTRVNAGTGGTEALRITNDGKVGIGTDSPLGEITIAKDAGGNAPTSVTAANTYLQLGSDDFGPSNNGKFMIGFGYTDAVNTNSPAYIGFEETDTAGDTKGALTFYTRDVTTDTAPTERMRILPAGGLTFNGDTAAANALDDYEEGTFTPRVFGTSSAGTGTYNYQRGGYVKIGKFVYAQVDISWSAHTGTGSLRLDGLPYNSGVSSSVGYGTPNVSYNSGMTWTQNQLGGYVSQNQDIIVLTTFNTSGNLTSVSMDSSVTELLFSVTYITA